MKGGADGAKNRLVATADVANGEPCVGETHMSGKVDAGGIPAAVGNALMHLLKRFFPKWAIGYIILSEITETGNTAHKTSFLRRIVGAFESLQQSMRKNNDNCMSKKYFHIKGISAII